MKNNEFAPIKDAYQLVQGAKIKGIKHEEVFELGAYDPIKRGYNIYPFEDGIKFNDFMVIVSETELMNHYMIEDGKGNMHIENNQPPHQSLTDLGMAS